MTWLVTFLLILAAYLGLVWLHDAAMARRSLAESADELARRGKR